MKTKTLGLTPLHLSVRGRALRKGNRFAVCVILMLSGGCGEADVTPDTSICEVDRVVVQGTWGGTSVNVSHLIKRYDLAAELGELEGETAHEDTLRFGVDASEPLTAGAVATVTAYVNGGELPEQASFIGRLYKDVAPGFDMLVAANSLFALAEDPNESSFRVCISQSISEEAKAFQPPSQTEDNMAEDASGGENQDDSGTTSTTSLGLDATWTDVLGYVRAAQPGSPVLFAAAIGVNENGSLPARRAGSEEVFPERTLPYGFHVELLDTTTQQVTRWSFSPGLFRLEMTTSEAFTHPARMTPLPAALLDMESLVSSAAAGYESNRNRFLDPLPRQGGVFQVFAIGGTVSACMRAPTGREIDVVFGFDELPFPTLRYEWNDVDCTASF